MAEPLPTFSTSADIAPLQGRFFSYARTLPAAAQPGAYALAKQTFGNIQALRDVQQAREQEAADRASALELKRAQLEEGRFQLAVAREKYRKSLVDTERGAAVAKEFADTFGRTDIDQAEKSRIADEIAIRNADVLGTNPVAASAYDTFKQSVSTPRANQYALEALARREGATPEDFQRYGVDPLTASAMIEQAKTEAAARAEQTEYIRSEKQRAAEEKAAKEKAAAAATRTKAVLGLASRAAEDISRRFEDNVESFTNRDYQYIDEALTTLDTSGLLTPADKEALADVGINTFVPKGKGKKRPAAKAQTGVAGADIEGEYANWPKNQRDTVVGILRSAAMRNAVPAQDLSFESVNQ